MKCKRTMYVFEENISIKFGISSFIAVGQKVYEPLPSKSLLSRYSLSPFIPVSLSDFSFPLYRSQLDHDIKALERFVCSANQPM